MDHYISESARDRISSSERGQHGALQLDLSTDGAAPRLVRGIAETLRAMHRQDNLRSSTLVVSLVVLGEW
eukprot:SAG11_NODE_621_length_8169_cov_2.866914_6_plen_70_part_00